MRRVLSLALIAVVTLGVSVPAFAQPAAPVPAVTITGFLDTITSWSKNLQDSLVTHTGDKEWYARNRGRVDVIGQLGTAKFVMGLEVDSTWGTTAITGADNNLAGGGTGAQRFGTTSAFDMNTDTQGSIEMKWLYTEFPLPFMPIPTIVRLGAQPFATQYKLAAYANGDFPGVNIDMNFSPNVKWHLTYAGLEENLTGSRRGGGTTFGRGDEFAIITSLEVTPIKGLDIRPLYSFFQAVGPTNGNSRIAAGQIGTAGGPTFTRGAIGGVGGLGEYEARHTIGIDARWRWGAFSLDPTFFYQFGQRDTDNPFVGPGAVNAVTNADISAFLFDVIGGWRIGPLLLEARYVYTSGNRPKDQLNRDINYYQPLSTDTSYWAGGWGNIYSLGIDYFNGAIKGMGVGIGMDRYGRNQFAVRATYSVTPALDVYAVVSPGWTARAVDTDGTTVFVGNGPAAGAVITCNTATANSTANPKGAGCNGDSTYIGTELNGGVTWRFAPGLTFDMVGAVLFAGGALDTSEVRNGVNTHLDSKNIYTIASRVRFSF